MDGWSDKWMVVRVYVWVGEWMGGQKDGLMDVQLDGWVDVTEQTAGWAREVGCQSIQ